MDDDAYNEETFGSSEYSSIETLPGFFVTQAIRQKGSALDQLARINVPEKDELLDNYRVDEAFGVDYKIFDSTNIENSVGDGKLGDFFLHKYDDSEADVLIDNHKSTEPRKNIVLANKVGPSIPPPGFSLAASDAFSIPKPHIFSVSNSFSRVSSIDSRNEGKSWAQISGEHVPVEASNFSYYSNPVTAGCKSNLLFNYDRPVLAVGPGGPNWVAPNGQPLGQRVVYPNIAHAGEIPPLPTTDSDGIKDCRGRSKMMKPADITFVVNKVMAPLEVLDAFSDDFYFLQFVLKVNNEKRRTAAMSGRFIPPLSIPLPTWKATRERVKLQLIETKMKQESRSRQWEEKEKVLGHLTKSDASKPRSVLSISLGNDNEMRRDKDKDHGEIRYPFATRLWGMRLAVQRGHEALSTVQELQHLLSQPVIINNATAREELTKHMDKAIKLLSTSIGVKPNLSKSGEVVLEGGLVAAMLQTTKGKKLMCRSIELLDDEQLWALTPVILARVFLTDHGDQIKIDQEVEEHLLTIISRFIIKTCNSFEISSPRYEPAVIEGTNNKLLFHLWQCLRSVVVSQTERLLLQKALLSSKVRAEVMQNVIQTGDRILGSIECRGHGENCKNWRQMREAFMCMLDNQDNL